MALDAAGFRIDTIVYDRREDAAALSSRISKPPKLVPFKRLEGLRSSIVLIAVQDDRLPDAAVGLAQVLNPKTLAFHTSGSLSSDVLSPLREAGCSAASLHPLVSVSSWKDSAPDFSGSYICLEGDSKAVKAGRRIVAALGANAFTIRKENKALYHAAALMAAGHVTALFDMAVELMERSGLGRRQAREVLAPLISGVAHNLGRQDTPDALTGTYARGDGDTAARHLNELTRKAGRDELAVYIYLALRSIELAEKRGLDAAAARQVREIVMLAKRQTGC